MTPRCWSAGAAVPASSGSAESAVSSIGAVSPARADPPGSTVSSAGAFSPVALLIDDPPSWGEFISVALYVTPGRSRRTGSGHWMNVFWHVVETLYQERHLRASPDTNPQTPPRGAPDHDRGLDARNPAASPGLHAAPLRDPGPAARSG